MDSQSISEPSMASSGEEANEAVVDTDDEELQEELHDALEIQQRSKANVRKHYKTYRESRKKVREIKKTRQPYMPMVALPPGEEQPPAASAPVIKPTFKYDRKGRGAAEGRRGDGGRQRKEDVHLFLQSQVLIEFSYMVCEDDTVEDGELEIFLASVPCTSSVIGERAAERLKRFLASRGVQGPESLELPPVQLRQFNGARTTSSRGLKWTICLGKLWARSPPT